MVDQEESVKQRLAELEDPVIKEKALDILKNGDPAEYIMGVFRRLHVGDEVIGKVLLLSIASQSISNSEGIQPKLSGASGKGKTHAAKAMFHLIPDVGYKLEGSLSAKTLFYHPDLGPGTIVFSDDVRIGPDLEDTLKRTMSNFQRPTKHRSLDKDHKYIELEIPARTVWWLTAVNSPYSDELLNRLYDLDVDDSVSQDQEVTKRQKADAVVGSVALPETEEVKVCRAIIHIVKGVSFEVAIPFAEDVEWADPSDRRQLPRFFDLVRSYTVLRFMQRQEILDGVICASLKDFEDAKAIVEATKTGITTKLTGAEYRLAKWMHEQGKPLSINDVIEGYKKKNRDGYTYQAIYKIIIGNGKDGKGLLDKVPGMKVVENGTETKYEVPALCDSGNRAIVCLRVEAYEKYKGL